MIKVSHLYKNYSNERNNIVAVNDVSFEINKGDIYGVIGLSGAGKSTLVRCLNLLEKPDQGEIVIDGDSMLSLSEKQLRQKRKKIAMVFQSFNLLSQISVLDNVCMPLTLSGIKKKEARVKALQYLDVVGLKDKADVYPEKLSGGQRQRVAIARALTSQPEIILCDEITSALDPETTKSILSLVKDINNRYGITIVLITHEMSAIQEICNRCAVLEQGKLVEENTVEELFSHPKTNAARRLIFNINKKNQKLDGRVIRIAFGKSNTNEPVISNLILEFGAPVNILESNISNINGEDRGQMLIQLPNDDQLANKMIDYLNGIESIMVEEVNDYVQ